jgi:hypothetical protein
LRILKFVGFDLKHLLLRATVRNCSLQIIIGQASNYQMHSSFLLFIIDSLCANTFNKIICIHMKQKFRDTISDITVLSRFPVFPCLLYFQPSERKCDWCTPWPPILVKNYTSYKYLRSSCKLLTTTRWIFLYSIQTFYFTPLLT